MTDDMLRLARAVYPDGRACIGDVYAVFDGELCVFLKNVVRVRNSARPGGWEQFDPANNASQFCDVLAWLACQTDVHINGECVATQLGIYSYEAGSGKGLAEAVVEAARRVAK